MTSNSAMNPAIREQLQAIVEESQLPFVDIDAGRGEESLLTYRASHDSRALPKTPLCLTASLTKPVVALAVLQLAAEGRLTLRQRMGDWLPEFRTSDFKTITLRHLLTHTSGLPDQLSHNAELRAAHAPLSEFRRGVCAHGTEFTPGTDFRYSSMGFLLLAEIVREVTELPIAQYLESRIFRPIGMANTWLGLPVDRPSLLDDGVPCTLPAWQEDCPDWNWNSAWWRQLGTPWGGMSSTANDLGQLLRLLLREGLNDAGERILPAVMCRAAIRNQSRTISTLPPAIREERPWGYGWKLQWPDHLASFGDFVPCSAAGHWGDSGTLMWLDPERNSYAVILTSTPFEVSRFALQRFSNVIANGLTK